MPSVTLDRVFISPVASLSTPVIGGSAGGTGGGGARTDEISLEGSFRSYANFVTRLVTGTAQTQIETLAIRALTWDQVSALKALIGQTCLFRDSYGRRIYGAFLDVVLTDIPLSGAAYDDLMTDVALVFQAVTYDEAV